MWFSSSFSQYFMTLISVDIVDLASSFWSLLNVLSRDWINCGLFVPPLHAGSEAISVWVCVQSLSRVRLFLTLWTIARQAPLSRQEYWSGVPFPTPGALPHPGIESTFPVSPALAGKFFMTEPLGKPWGVSTLSLLWMSQCLYHEQAPDHSSIIKKISSSKLSHFGGYFGKISGFESIWVQIPVLLCLSSVTLIQLFNFFEPQFLHLQIYN